MQYFVYWYIAISLLGWVTFPLAYRAFPALHDRGYSFTKILGLLLWGFVFWLMVSFGLLRNEVGGLIFAFTVTGAFSIWVFGLGWEEPEGKPATLYESLGELKAWLKDHIRLILSVEVLFLVAFAAWAFVRANNPDATGTEKPMELAFINAILRSPVFPPHDPWLSGYGISYYYFGYVMTAMLAMITSVSGGVAFNLMLSLIFGLSVTGAYGLLYNLLCAYWGSGGAGRKVAALVGAFFGPLFLVFVSNAEGFLEVLRAFGIGWTKNGFNFWLWLNMKDLSVMPTEPLGWNPRFWFWWRASRVIHDYDLAGNFVEVIDEFPFFSYLLGDLHPHVLAMPFGILAAALALNLYLGGWDGETHIYRFSIPVKKIGLVLLAISLGGLAFLNTWDFPVYLTLVCGAFLLRQIFVKGWRWNLLEELAWFAIPLGVISILLYLPFYVSFSSQAGGILPNVIFPSRGAYIWIMFAPLLIPIFILLGWMKNKMHVDWVKGVFVGLAFALFLWAFSVLLGWLAGQTEAGRSMIASQGFGSASELLLQATIRRLQYGGGLLTLVVLLGASMAYALPWMRSTPKDSSSRVEPLPFVLMLVVLGGLLVMGPEFVYLRDQFGTRMNTVFKFYYQAWALWSIVASFACVVIATELRRMKLFFFGLTTLFVLVMGLTYPVIALPEKTADFNVASPKNRTLDSVEYMKRYYADDYAAIQWLLQSPSGNLAEAVGGSYSEFARVATISGQPAILGWPGHEGQWRGGYDEVAGREDDISRLYSTSSWNEARDILTRYDIRYVYVGSLERSKYQVNEDKFFNNLSQVFRQGQAVIYQVP